MNPNHDRRNGWALRLEEPAMTNRDAPQSVTAEASSAQALSSAAGLSRRALAALLAWARWFR
jgi:hypothetical protein